MLTNVKQMYVKTVMFINYLVNIDFPLKAIDNYAVADSEVWFLRREWGFED